MKKRLLSTLVAVCVGAALAGCGSPATGTAFQPPTGWKSTPGMFGRMQMWMTGSGSSDRQILMVVRGDRNTRASDVSMRTSPFGGAQGMRDVKRDTITLCGNQRAEHFTGRGEGGNGANRTEQRIEGVVTTIGDAKYFALYIRPAALPADAQAENALHSLCPKSS